MSILTALTCTKCDEFEPNCRCASPSIPIDSMSVTPTPTSAPALTEADVRRIVAEMLGARTEQRLETLRAALRKIAHYDDDALIGEFIEIAACSLQADEKLARGES